MLFILAAGSYYDIREHRIPNWLILSGMLLGTVLQVYLAWDGEGSGSILWPVCGFLLRMLAAAVLFFILFVFRMIGAGDVKLMALICGYLGGPAGAVALGYGFAAGAVLSLVKMLYRRSFWTRLSYLSAYIRRLYHTRKITAYYDPARDGSEAVIPFGFCLFLGTFIYLFIKTAG